jgi:hypothetical protein
VYPNLRVTLEPSLASGSPESELATGRKTSRTFAGSFSHTLSRNVRNRGESTLGA